MAIISWQTSFTAEQNKIKNLEKLYKGEHSVLMRDANGQPVSGALFTPVDLNWLGNRLTDRLVDLVFPKLPALKAESEALQPAVDLIEKKLDLANVCPATAQRASFASYAVWKMYWSNVAKAPALRIWGEEPGEFTWWEYAPGDKAQPYAVQFWREEVVKDRDDKDVTYKVCERFCLADYYEDEAASAEDEAATATSSTLTGCIKTTTAYKLDNSKYVDVPLDKVFPNLDEDALALLAYEEFPELTALPGFKINNAGCTSDYTRGLQNLQVNLDKLAAQRQGVIDFCGFPHIGIPERMIDPSSGMIDMRRMMMEVDYGDKKVPVTITNWDGNLSVSKEQWDLYDDEFYKLTIISPAIEGKEGASTSGTARRLGLYKTEVGVTRRREQYNAAFEWAVRTAQELAAHMQGTDYESADDYGAPITTLSIDWPRPIPMDMTDMILYVQMGLDKGIMSDDVAIALYHEDDNWSAKDVQDEKLRLDASRAEVRAEMNQNFMQNPMQLPAFGM